MLVARQVTGRNQLVVETACGRRLGMALLGRKRERVLVLAAHAPAIGDVLAGFTHRLERKALLEPRVREPPAERGVVQRAIPAREAHARALR